MNQQKRTGMALGLLLVLVGVFFLAGEIVPGLRDWARFVFAWPISLVLVGAGLLLLGLIVGNPGMAIPASILAGLGGIFYWQTTSHNWTSWAYIWTLIPGFVGVGVIAANILGGREAFPLSRGLRLILTSLVLFVVFGAIMGAFSGFGLYWPLLLIAAGIILFIVGFIRH
ncbi:MAG: hypothetical protein AB9891_09315 [Anaerolineaceae bacterium]